MSATEIKIPSLGESVQEGTIARWVVGDGEIVEADATLLELETDKAMMEIPAEVGGRVEILVAEGETVEVGQVVARITPAEGAATGRKPKSEPAGADKAASEGDPEAAAADAADKPAATPAPEAAKTGSADVAKLSPAVERMVRKHDLDPAGIDGTGPGGRILKQDIERHMAAGKDKAPRNGADKPAATAAAKPAAPAAAAATATADGPEQERVPMSRIRKRIAERLVEAQHTAAILTTFNDVDMSAVMALRKRHRDSFEKRHGVRLGFMSLFGRAVVLALQELRELNAYIEGDEIVYHRHVHLGIAVGTDRGLMVPVIRKADTLSLAGLEAAIGEMAERTRNNRITPDDLAGGTFSISNGGVYGSLLSTPILNPPQSGILGMHRIEERPVVVDGEIVIRPMMYLALSYDHRIVDGEQAVTFLVRVKQYLEDPARMLIEA